MRESPFDKHYLRERKRAAILSEAAALFNIHGARTTRLSDVARRLDLNQSSLYYYVRSKDDLIYQTYLESCRTIAGMLDQACEEGSDAAGRLAAFVRLYFAAWQAIARGERPHFAILTEIRGLKAHHRQDIAGRYLNLFARVRSLLEEGGRDGSLTADRPQDTALAVFGLVQMTVLWVHKLEAGDYPEAADAFVDILFRGIASDPHALPEYSSTTRLAAEVAARTAAPADRPEAFRRVGSDIFNRKGYRGTSLDEIAERLEVSKGSFYHHVRDKDDLLRQCFLQSLDRMAEAQERAAKAPGSGLERLWACAVELFTLQNSAAGPLLRFNMIPSLAPRYQAAFRNRLAEISGAFGDCIRQGIRDASVREVHPLVAEQMLLTTIDLSADLGRLRPVEDPGEAFESFFGFYFSGLAPRPRMGANAR